ncbi:hypothetical protein HDG39_004239 [Paraburkholderia sp. WSM4180]|nr:hypothetical protein [Paraburkholderia sp. WSM4180]
MTIGCENINSAESGNGGINYAGARKNGRMPYTSNGERVWLVPMRHSLRSQCKVKVCTSLGLLTPIPTPDTHGDRSNRRAGKWK